MLQVNGGNKSKTISKASFVFPPIKGDVAVRQKCREMIENSLTSDESSGMFFSSKLVLSWPLIFPFLVLLLMST